MPAAASLNPRPCFLYFNARSKTGPGIYCMGVSAHAQLSSPDVTFYSNGEHLNLTVDQDVYPTACEPGFTIHALALPCLGSG